MLEALTINYCAETEKKLTLATVYYIRRTFFSHMPLLVHWSLPRADMRVSVSLSRNNFSIKVHRQGYLPNAETDVIFCTYFAPYFYLTFSCKQRAIKLLT